MKTRIVQISKIYKPAQPMGSHTLEGYWLFSVMYGDKCLYQSSYMDEIDIWCEQHNCQIEEDV